MDSSRKVTSFSFNNIPQLPVNSNPLKCISVHYSVNIITTNFTFKYIFISFISLVHFDTSEHGCFVSPVEMTLTEH